MSREIAVIAKTSFPAYAVQMISDRHFIVCGGGGSAKTGVLNLMEIYYIDVNDKNELRAVKALSYSTELLAVMNIDSALLYHTNPNLGQDMECSVLLATGQDRFCKVYGLDFNVVNVLDDGTAFTDNIGTTQRAVLGFDVKLIRSVQTDSHCKSPGQKAVAFSHDGTFFITGGYDGHFRIWSFPSCKKILDHNAHKDDIDDIALTPDSTKFLTLGRDSKAYVWSVDDASKVADVVNPPPGVPEKHRFRAAKFVPIGKGGFLFFTASIPVRRIGKEEKSFLTQWILLSRKNECIPLKTAPVANETVSCIAVSQSGYLLAIGTLGGSIQIWDSRELETLVTFKQSHATFVTRLMFLPSRPKPETKLACWAVENRCGVVSISADQLVKLHVIPKKHPRGFFSTMFWISFMVLLSAGVLSIFEV